MLNPAALWQARKPSQSGRKLYFGPFMGGLLSARLTASGSACAVPKTVAHDEGEALKYAIGNRFAGESEEPVEVEPAFKVCLRWQRCFHVIFPLMAFTTESFTVSHVETMRPAAVSEAGGDASVLTWGSAPGAEPCRLGRHGLELVDAPPVGNV